MLKYDSNRLRSLFVGLENLSLKECIFWACGGVTADLWYDAVVSAGYKSKYRVDKYKAGQVFRGESLITPDYLFSEIGDKNAYVYIVFTIDPIRLIQIKEELLEYGVDSVNIVSCSTAHYYAHKQEIETFAEELKDDESKRHLEAFLRCRMFGELIPEKDMIRGLQYFSVLEFQKIDRNEIFVDAGAFVGDTIEKFLFEKFGTFKKYYAFEPYRDSYMAMDYRVERLKKEWAIPDSKIIIENMGLDVRSGYAKMNDSLDAVGAVIEDNTASSADDNDSTIITIRLDDYFEKNEFTTLKADIEGKEMDLLRGGENTIKRYGVKLAISVYHRPNDIIDIPRKIKKINKDYKFKFRCHTQDGSDSILYAYL